MLALLGLCKVEACPSGGHVLAVLKIIIEHLLEIQALRTTLHKGQIVDVEVGLKSRILEQMIDYNLTYSVFFQLNHDSYAIAAGFVSYC